MGRELKGRLLYDYVSAAIVYIVEWEGNCEETERNSPGFVQDFYLDVRLVRLGKKKKNLMFCLAFD